MIALRCFKLEYSIPLSTKTLFLYVARWPRTCSYQLIMIHFSKIPTTCFDQNVNQEIIDNQGPMASVASIASTKKVPAKAVEISGALELEPKAVSTGPQWLGWIRTWDDKICFRYIYIYTFCRVFPPNKILFNEFQKSNLSGQNRSVSLHPRKAVQLTNNVFMAAISCYCLVKRISKYSELDLYFPLYVSLVHSKSSVHSAIFIVFWPSWKDVSNPVNSGTNYQAQVVQEFCHQSVF